MSSIKSSFPAVSIWYGVPSVAATSDRQPPQSAPSAPAGREPASRRRSQLKHQRPGTTVPMRRNSGESCNSDQLPVSAFQSKTPARMSRRERTRLHLFEGPLGKVGGAVGGQAGMVAGGPDVQGDRAEQIAG